MLSWYLCKFLIFWETAPKDHDRVLTLLVQLLLDNW